MNKREKRRAWLLVGSVLLALWLLAAGLSELKLSEGWPWSVWWQLLFGDLGHTGDAVAPIPFGNDMALLARTLSVLFLSLLLFFIIGIIFFPDMRKQMLRELLRVLLFIFLAWLLLRSSFMETMTQMVEPIDLSNMAMQEDPLPEASLEDIPEFETNSPPWLTWAASFVLALALVLGLARLIWAATHRLTPKTTPMDELAQGAQSALDALQAGADFRNTIIRCYREMSEVLRTQRGIQRDSAMTPREFESRLAHYGLPGSSVHQLTLLFEKVRYGAAMPGEQEEDQAIVCLTSIVEACRNM
ncbi:MAG TPA: DUF4129 domain-containing protein [Anaerolineae bacterium]|nr:DUF4129 domain-containing protein [Anaerolineae bacterium]